MAAVSDEVARRLHLVDRQLQDKEVVDGVFEVSLDRVVAVTSQRIMIVSGGDAKGWALTGIPWRVITGVEFVAGESGDANSLEVKYTTRSSRAGRKGEFTETEAAADVCPEKVDDAQRMVRLIETRIASSRADS
jgi:hypothetical protein